MNHSCICHAAYPILNWREMFEDTNNPPIPDMTSIAYTGKRKEFDVDIYIIYGRTKKWTKCKIATTDPFY